MPVCGSSRWIGGEVALAAPRGRKAAGAADGEETGREAAFREPADDGVEADAMAADDDEIRRPQVRRQQRAPSPRRRPAQSVGAGRIDETRPPARRR